MSQHLFAFRDEDLIKQLCSDPIHGARYRRYEEAYREYVANSN